MTYALFPSKAVAELWVASIDAAFGWPDDLTQTYCGQPEETNQGWSVRLKPWLKADVGQSVRWKRKLAQDACKTLTTTDAKPVPVKPPPPFRTIEAI